MLQIVYRKGRNEQGETAGKLFSRMHGYPLLGAEG